MICLACFIKEGGGRGGGEREALALGHRGEGTHLDKARGVSQSSPITDVFMTNESNYRGGNR